MRRKTFYAGIVMVLGTVAVIYGGVSNFSVEKLISALIFLSGTTYAILERNFMIGLITLFATLALPKVSTWLVVYWPWVKIHFFGP